MSNFDPQAYGPVLALLVSGDRLRPLDEGSPEKGMRRALEELDVNSAFAHVETGVTDRKMAECCLAGVWLLHDFLDASHQISQGIDTTSGSFWHGIMHRREGDFSNAKYWFRHVGHHPVFDLLAERVGTWDPLVFVDQCQVAVRSGNHRDRCLDRQQLEWELLFDFCYRAAIGE